MPNEPSHDGAQSTPKAWHERFEQYLDTDHRRAAFYGGIFTAFVLAIIVAAAVFAIVNRPPV